MLAFKDSDITMNSPRPSYRHQKKASGMLMSGVIVLRDNAHPHCNPNCSGHAGFQAPKATRRSPIQPRPFFVSHPHARSPHESTKWPYNGIRQRCQSRRVAEVPAAQVLFCVRQRDEVGKTLDTGQDPSPTSLET
jgi:hypothetical protein